MRQAAMAAIWVEIAGNAIT
jgi:hypothetical protein